MVIPIRLGDPHTNAMSGAERAKLKLLVHVSLM